MTEKTRDQSWETSTLADLFVFLKGSGLSKGVISAKGKFKCILYGELYTTYPEVIKEIFARTDTEGSVRSKSGDLLIPSSTTTSAIDLANVTALMEDDILLGGDINILRPHNDKVHSAFYAYYLTHYKRNELAKGGQGITIIHLYNSYIKNVLVDIPPFKEQVFIANILQTWDTAIEKTQSLIAVKEQQLGLIKSLLLKEVAEQDKTKRVSLGNLLNYEQPTQYIVKSTNYIDYGCTPVLTANKSFILGNTNESKGIFDKIPVIIFDDFTTDRKYVDFRFKVKSSAMKILSAKNEKINLYYIYMAMSLIRHPLGGHKRYWISEYQFLDIPLPSFSEQNRIANILNTARQEIDILKNLTEQYRAQKRGLMQKLLTGKWRMKNE